MLRFKPGLNHHQTRLVHKRTLEKLKTKMKRNFSFRSEILKIWVEIRQQQIRELFARADPILFGHGMKLYPASNEQRRHDEASDRCFSRTFS